MTGNWQPIETAPKTDSDGYSIDILVTDGQDVDVAFYDAEGIWRCGHPRKPGWASRTDHDGYEHAALEPTHWMPLPEPPK
jgi:hypothetical protein